jgi:hypothetical protein
MTKLAQVYQRDESWYFGSQSKATTGLWIATPPLVEMSRHDSRLRKGEAAVEVLNASREGVPLPEDTDAGIIPLLTKARVKSWSQFMKKAKCVGLELENNQLTIRPYGQIPHSKGAMEGIEGQHIVLAPDASPEEVGAGLEEAMRRSR